jgi:hypothetical protein
MAKRTYTRRPPEERFWEKVDKSSDCWIWTGAKIRGYGTFMVATRKDVRAHRWSYEQANGPIPPGLVINHLCRNPACVRPDHLEAVTQRENLRYSDQILKVRSAATHCKNGHELSPDNLLARGDGYRGCKACHRASQERYLLRRSGHH